MGDAIIDGMKNEIERQSFRSHFGQQIFCPCKSVLDVRKSVAVYVWLEKGLVFSRVFCGACFDRTNSNGGLARGVKAAGVGATLETYDGRSRWSE